MREVLLARHGIAGSNRDGIASCGIPGEGLTEAGVAQARALARVLAAEEVGVAVTSRLGRTQETLALALDGLDVPVVVAPELDEIHFGSFGGGPLATYRAWAASHPPDLPPPGGGESRAQAAARFALGLRLVLERGEERVLVVGHALAIRYAVDAAAGLAPAARMAPIEHAAPYPLDRDGLERAVGLLERWSLAPLFRDSSNEG